MAMRVEFEDGPYRAKTGTPLAVTLRVRSSREAKVTVLLHCTTPSVSVAPRSVELTPARDLRDGTYDASKPVNVTLNGPAGKHKLDAIAGDGTDRSRDATIVTLTA